jgi:hypothetical protein
MPPQKQEPSSSTSPTPTRLFASKDDLTKEERDEMGMILDQLLVTCENQAKSEKSVKRRYGRDYSKDIDENVQDLNNLVAD